MVFLVRFRVVHLGSPWTRRQCFVHHPLNKSHKTERQTIRDLSFAEDEVDYGE